MEDHHQILMVVVLSCRKDMRQQWEMELDGESFTQSIYGTFIQITALLLFWMKMMEDEVEDDGRWRWWMYMTLLFISISKLANFSYRSIIDEPWSSKSSSRSRLDEVIQYWFLLLFFFLFFFYHSIFHRVVDVPLLSFCISYWLTTHIYSHIWSWS